MASTTNYGWVTPDDTSLVKDGASAIRTLGSSVDTTVKNLNPETTLGDISYRSSTANTNTRLAIGTTGQVLTVNGGVPAWTTISSGGMTSIASGSLSGASVNLTSISGSYNHLQLILNNPYSTNSSAFFSVNTDRGSNYNYNRLANGTYSAGHSQTELYLAALTGIFPTSSQNAQVVIDFYNYASTTAKKNINYFFVKGTGSDTSFSTSFSSWNSASAITSIQLDANGTWSGGTYILYGVK